MRHGITTTVAKAKALRKYVEPLLTKSKEDTTHNRRIVFSSLKSKEVLKELFDEVATKIADRPGGYTRIIKLGSRLGDDAEMALIELVDYNENLLGGSGEAKEKKKSTRRSRRGGGTKSTSAKSEGTSSEVKEAKEEAPKKEAKKDDAPKAEAKKEETPKAEAKKEEAPKAEKKETKSDDKSDEKKGNE